MGSSHGVLDAWQEAEGQPFTIKIFDNGHFEGGGVVHVSMDIKTLQELTA